MEKLRPWRDWLPWSPQIMYSRAGASMQGPVITSLHCRCWLKKTKGSRKPWNHNASLKNSWQLDFNILATISCDRLELWFSRRETEYTHRPRPQTPTELWLTTPVETSWEARPQPQKTLAQNDQDLVNNCQFPLFCSTFDSGPLR